MSSEVRSSTLYRSALALLLLAALAPSLSAQQPETMRRISATVRELSSHGSRMPGYPGDRHAADYVEAQLQAAGVADVKREPFDVTVPIDKGAGIELLDADGRVIEQIELLSLWPNLVRTNTTGPEGLTGDLFYGGNGEYEDFNGFKMDGSIVLMEFNTWKNWKNAAALGARAIIFIEPESTTLWESRYKWSWAPVHIPRFWLSRQAALALKQRLDGGKMTARVSAQMDFESHTSWNLWGTIPGQDPELADQVIAIQAYYDGISVVPADNPAAESTGSIAALLELARYLREHPPGRTVVLVASGSNFQGQRGLFEWFDLHARTIVPFRDRMPQRFLADSLDVARLIRETNRRSLSLDSLGIKLRSVAGQTPTFESVDVPRVQALLKLRRIKPDSLGIKLEPDSLDIDLFIALELSSKSDQVGLVHSARLAAHRRYFVPFGRNFTTYAEHAAGVLDREPSSLVQLISPVKGLSDDSYLDNDVYRESGEVARDVGLMALNLITTTDKRMVLDTPLDTPDKVNVRNLARQSEFINVALTQALGDPGLFGEEPAMTRKLHDKNIKDIFVAINGRLRLLPRRSAEPKDPIANGMVVIVNSFYRDMWRPTIYLTDKRGEYNARGLGKWRTQIRGFKVDPATGDVIYATDQGARAQKIGAWEQTLSKVETVWTTIMFPAENLEVHDRVHAHFHFTMGNNYKRMKVLDRRGAAPQQYGFVMGDFDEQMMVLYADEDDSLRFVDESMILLNNEGTTDELSGQGRGFDFTEHRMIPHAMLQSTQDMWRLDEARIERMRKFAIENPRIDALHQRAARSLELAEAAMADLNWGDYIKYAREAIGLEFNAYPDVRGTQNDVINGLVFFVALLVPAAFFAERLLFASTDINRQLSWFAGIMLFIWVILSQVHPAFELAEPIIVLLALLVMVMAFFVITLVVSRFNNFMTELRQARSGTATGDISRTGTAYVAFMLGISNMRRRALRTSLTLATITLLTFTVLSFTSFKPQIQFVGFFKDWTPAYHGVLMHDIHWWSWEPTHFDYLDSHFGNHGTVVQRTWDVMGFEEDGFIPIRREGREADALGVMGFEPDESKVTGIDRALIAGSWFEDQNELSVILSDQIAASLEVSVEQIRAAEAGQVSRPQVFIYGRYWDVRGIYDSEEYESLHDLNDEPLTPAKERFEQFNMPGMDVMFMMNEMMFFDSDVDIGFEHQPAERLVIVPFHQLESMGADLMSVAIHFDDGADAEKLIKSYLSRASFRLFVGMPNEDGELKTYAYTAFGATSMEGLGALVIPMLIAALIVLNTMMGAVYERFREIGVYSSVGLAPIHISYLFVAEACVYGVLGVVIGYIIGQVSAKGLLLFDMLSGISLNYSSTSAIAGATLVMLVVLASSIYPARVAAKLAVPDVVRRWQLPDPKDDVWQFPFPFTVNVNAVESLCGYLHTLFMSYGHESVGKMYTERTRILREETDQRPQYPQYAVQLLLWLAPFDMGVSQYLQFTMRPSADNPRIYEIELFIRRISGPIAFWRRLNLGFMLDLRKQFLVWQTLKNDLQEEHAEACRRVSIDASELEEEHEAAG